MKIDLSQIDREQFMVHEHELAGETVYLVQPVHIGAKFTKDNLIFRSSVWDKHGNLISASFPKFFNLGEHPELTPVPTSLKDTQLRQKLDGSTLIFSRWNGHTIVRTRGTVDARTQDNGAEIDVLLAKYPNVKNLLESYHTYGASLLFEWLSPKNVIVIRPEELDMLLIGMIYHDDYRLVAQDVLDGVAQTLGVKRPKSFSFDSVEQMQQEVSAFKGVEGLCMYYNNGQNILKVKGDWYLRLHRMKSEVSSLEKVMDVWIAQGKPSYTDFYNFLVNTFDYEIAEQARGHVSRICDAYKEVEDILHAMRNFLTPFMVSDASRKDVALAIQQAYGTTSRASFAFRIYDRKPLVPDDIKRLLFQVLKS